MKLIGIYLSERQLGCLKEEAKKKDMAYSEIIRRLLDTYYFEEPIKNTKFDKLKNENT